MRYDHTLSGPLSSDGMHALFSVAVAGPMSKPARVRHFERWCLELQQRAGSLGIMWVPDAGTAVVFSRMSPERLAAILLRIVESTPVFRVAGTQPPPPPRRPGRPLPGPAHTDPRTEPGRYVITIRAQRLDATVRSFAGPAVTGAGLSDPGRRIGGGR